MRYFEAQSQSWVSPGTSRNHRGDTVWSFKSMTGWHTRQQKTLHLHDNDPLGCSRDVLLFADSTDCGVRFVVQSLLLLSTAAWEWTVTQCHVSNCKMEMNTRLTSESDWRGLKALGAQNNSQYTTAWVLVTLTFPPFLADIYEIEFVFPKFAM